MFSLFIWLSDKSGKPRCFSILENQDLCVSLSTHIQAISYFWIACADQLTITYREVVGSVITKQDANPVNFNNSALSRWPYSSGYRNYFWV